MTDFLAAFLNPDKTYYETKYPQPLTVPEEINESWSSDFTSDTLWCGGRFKTFNVVSIRYTPN